MKKIFAIALALVMVLSMTAAFAASSLPGTCDWGSWDCTTYTSNCGVAKAEVVKFVRTNDCDPFVESDCAAVVVDERVYFGVKVVFDDTVNAQWLTDANTKLEISVSKLETVGGAAYALVNAPIDLEAMLLAGTPAWSALTADQLAKKVSGKTFWYDVANRALVEERTNACIVADAFAGSTAAKVCANVSYSHNGEWATTAPLSMGKYDIAVVKGAGKNYQITMTDKATNDTAVFGVLDGILKWVEFGSKKYNVYADGKFYAVDFSSTGETCTYADEMLAFLKLSLGDCVTADGIKAFFGWDDDDAFENCATWTKGQAAVVDAECVVAIPKTGDASVLAWLF